MIFFYLREPEVKVLDACVEVLLLVGLFEFLAFLCRFVDEELPLFIESAKACLRTGPVIFEQNYYFSTKTLHLNSLLTPNFLSASSWRAEGFREIFNWYSLTNIAINSVIMFCEQTF